MNNATVQTLKLPFVLCPVTGNAPTYIRTQVQKIIAVRTLTRNLTVR